MFWRRGSRSRWAKWLLMPEYPTALLGSLAATERSAIAIGPFGSRMKADVYVEAGVPVIRGTNIGTDRSLKGDWVYVPESFADTIPACHLRSGDLVFPHRGSIGEVALVEPAHAPMVLSSSMMKFRPDPERLDSRFAYYFFRSKAGRDEIMRFASQVGTPGIGQPLASLRQFRIPLPPRPCQSRIADTLALLDDKIELNRRMNETLEAMAQAIFRDWFVDFGPVRRKLAGATDPVEIMGGVTTDPSRAAELAALFPADMGSGLPEGWGQTSVYDIASVQYGAPFASNRFNSARSGRPLVRIRDLRSHGSDIFTDEVHPKEHVIRAGDVVVGMDGEFRAYLWQGPDSLMNQRVCSFMPRQPHLRAFTWFSINPLLASMERAAVGTTVIHLGKKDIDRFDVVDPGARIAAKFGALVEPMLDRLVLSGSENRTLAETRDYLLPRLMSGEVPVGGVAQEIAA